MSIQIIGAIAAFIILFGVWVILPNRIAKHHERKVEEREE
jgi:hypothetical protein